MLAGPAGPWAAPHRRTVQTAGRTGVLHGALSSVLADVGLLMVYWSEEGDELMPLFKITCRRDIAPHPYLGRVIYTQDPGRALISGKCNDVGTIVMQQFRGLAARAPYFSNGSAALIIASK